MKKLNKLDIFIIAVVVIAVILGVYKLGYVNRQKGTGSTASYVDVEYKAIVEEVRKPTVDALHEGDKLFDDTTDTPIGVITAVEASPYLTTELTSDGRVVQSEKPGYYIVELTVSASMIEKENGYFLGGVVELKANSKFKVYTKYAEPTIQISEIDLPE